ncbi:MAG TPA: methyltransferase domain-containing protein, partial [Allosphingosinicella sp.]
MIRPLLLAAGVLALAAGCAPQTDVSAPLGSSGAMSRRPVMAEDAALQRVLADPARSADDKSRDQYRHPYEALTFWGLRPGMTILEVGPGAGWWTEILAPYARATGGRFIATGPDISSPTASAAARKARSDFEAKYANAARYGTVNVWGFGATSAPLPEPGSVDFILVARAFHNWARQGEFTDKAMRDFSAALKPGGVLAVEQHRALEGADPKAGTGYVPESYVIQAAERAGLRLDGKSEVNANPKDDRDHPFGVWTLQPVARTSPLGQPDNPAFDRSPYDPIGESD